MGAAAIMLAGKLENCYRPARDVVMATWVVKSVSKPEQRQWLSDQVCALLGGPPLRMGARTCHHPGLGAILRVA